MALLVNCEALMVLMATAMLSIFETINQSASLFDVVVGGVSPIGPNT